MGLEGDEEVMSARQATLGHVSQRLAHDAAQCIVDHPIVAQTILCHPPCVRSLWSCPARLAAGFCPEMLGGFCCPVPPGPRFPKLVRQREPNGYRWHF